MAAIPTTAKPAAGAVEREKAPLGLSVTAVLVLLFLHLLALVVGLYGAHAGLVGGALFGRHLGPATGVALVEAHAAPIGARAGMHARAGLRRSDVRKP